MATPKSSDFYITTNTSGFDNISINGGAGGGCWTTTLPTTTSPTWTFNELQGDGMTITVVETIDGFKGQSHMSIGGKNIIVWEDSIAVAPNEYAKEASKGVPATDGVSEARKAAQLRAEQAATAAIRSLFKESS